jgi:hypothetical protein
VTASPSGLRGFQGGSRRGTGRSEMTESFGLGPAPGADFDRRAILAAAASLLATGCAGCADLEPLGPIAAGERRVGDGHAHLFNAADLPVGGFVEHVLLPAYLGAWPALWPALVSLSRLLKTLAVSASEEHRSIFSPASAEVPAVSPERFADVIADEIEAQAALSAAPSIVPIGEQPALADSHALLGILIQEASNVQKGQAGPLSPAVNADRSLRSSVGRIDRAFIARVALYGSRAGPASLAGSPMFPDLLPSSSAGLPRLWDGVKWIYALIQPRCTHVHRYLRTMTAARTRTVRVVNLLVDYDLWLADSASSGSGLEEQLRFWTAYRRRSVDRIAIETFAPYDPLRHAEDRLRTGNDEGYFGTLRSWAEGGAADEIEISGFKLYPPMGFRAKGNQGPPPHDRAGRIIRKRWDGVWPLESFGAELDRSLDRFFDYCSEKRIPIMAHASAGNEASAGAGSNANPAYWLDRALSIGRPPSVCLAHFSADQFGEAVYRRVLEANAAGKSQIYFDLSFASELLDGRERQLMEQIAGLCAAADPECRWFVFGTDWIMLANQHEVHRYIPKLLAAAGGIEFWKSPGILDNLLYNNLDRFLSRN